MPLEFDNRPAKSHNGLLIWSLTIALLAFISFKAFQYVQDHKRKEAVMARESVPEKTTPTATPRDGEAVLVAPAEGPVSEAAVAKKKAPSAAQLLDREIDEKGDAVDKQRPSWKVRATAVTPGRTN